MTLSASQPTDQALNATWPYWIRKHAVEINTIIADSSGITNTELSIVGGTTALVVGTDLATVKIETILLSATGPATLAQIRGGFEGQIKIFIMQNNNIIFTDGVKSLGGLYLNQLPALSNFVAQQDDVLAFINVDGDGATNYGYWKELWRQISVK